MFFGLKTGHRNLLNLALHLERNVPDAKFDFRHYTTCIFGHGKAAGLIDDPNPELSIVPPSAEAFGLSYQIARRLVLGYRYEEGLRRGMQAVADERASEVSRLEAARRCRVAVAEAMMSSEVV